MEDNILKDTASNFLDAANALEEFLKNFEIDSIDKDQTVQEIFQNIKKNKNLLFKELE